MSKHPFAKPGVTDNRAYRRLHHGAGLCYYGVSEGETDLHIGSERDMRKEALAAAQEARRQVVAAISGRPDFLTTLTPLLPAGEEPVALSMIQATSVCGVGPMAAVAGAIAAYVGTQLPGDLVVENGGDLFIRSAAPRIVAVYAGDSPFSEKLGVRVHAPEGCGVCTSAGRVGPSLSFGDADAVMIVAPNAALADACATAAGNRVQGENGLQAAVAFASGIPGIVGALAIRGEQMAAWGEMELVRL